MIFASMGSLHQGGDWHRKHSPHCSPCLVFSLQIFLTWQLLRSAWVSHICHSSPILWSSHLGNNVNYPDILLETRNMLEPDPTFSPALGKIRHLVHNFFFECVHSAYSGQGEGLWRCPDQELAGCARRGGGQRGSLALITRTSLLPLQPLPHSEHGSDLHPAPLHFSPGGRHQSSERQSFIVTHLALFSLHPSAEEGIKS